MGYLKFFLILANYSFLFYVKLWCVSPPHINCRKGKEKETVLEKFKETDLLQVKQQYGLDYHQRGKWIVCAKKGSLKGTWITFFYIYQFKFVNRVIHSNYVLIMWLPWYLWRIYCCITVSSSFRPLDHWLVRMGQYSFSKSIQYQVWYWCFSVISILISILWL